MAAKDFIGYKSLLDKALRSVVRDALTHAAKGGVMGSHHFVISLDTRAPGVEISDVLRERFPVELTIVLQHQYWNLKIAEDAFEVGLSFNKVPEQIRVPFAAITQFVDPSQNFGHRFEGASAPATPAAKAKAEPEIVAPASTQTGDTPPDPAPNDPTVVSLDKFRKK